jgi:Calcineurin-like phosphoesterase/Iron/zinc purple acid phosphatase-like protein C
MATHDTLHDPTGASSRSIGRPVFAQPEATADPTKFRIKHPSDDTAYKGIDELNREHKIHPLPFPPPRGLPEPRLTLQQVFGGSTAAINNIEASGQIVFHATGDCGSTRGPESQNEVTDKMEADFDESDLKEVPQFNLLLGDVVYSFGEAQYYYDQFYEPYRSYPAPILAVAGNHDGMISPLAHAQSLAAYLRNFCAEPGSFLVSPDAGGLSRTAQVQPGVFFTFEAPFIRVLALYSNTLEDPGVIADDTVGQSQLEFIETALKRVKQEGYKGALVFADHHPPYTAGSIHGWSVEMLAQIDEICAKAGVWPHAFLSGHAHNYQRFTRTRKDGTQVPYVICGNGGHALTRLDKHAVLRTPQIIQKANGETDQVVFENYDDQDYGYLRVVVNANQLRIEYHPASDGATAKTPDDFVTVDLHTRKLVHFAASDIGRSEALDDVRRSAATPHRHHHHQK